MYRFACINNKIIIIFYRFIMNVVTDPSMYCSSYLLCYLFERVLNILLCIFIEIMVFKIY